jgi:trehalose 6-phosphate phosphatase
MSTLPKLLTQGSALFLDFDGTLTDLALRPDAVDVPDDLARLLDRLHEQLNGALAVVTGRAREDIEPMLSPWRWPAAFEHGALRISAHSDGAAHRPQGLNRAEAAAKHLVERHTGLLLETKQTSMALHFRLAPSLENLCVQTLSRAIENESGLQLMRGKAVIEVKSVGVNKGLAIQAFMNEAPFAGRQPVFAGDDVTDEAGFAVVQRLGGAGIKVGTGSTCAQYRCDTPQTLRAWLAEATQTPLIQA